MESEPHSDPNKRSYPKPLGSTLPTSQVGPYFWARRVSSTSSWERGPLMRVTVPTRCYLLRAGGLCLSPTAPKMSGIRVRTIFQFSEICGFVLPDSGTVMPSSPQGPLPDLRAPAQSADVTEPLKTLKPVQVVVLDLFCGRGLVGRACAELGFKSLCYASQCDGPARHKVLQLCASRPSSWHFPSTLGYGPSCVPCTCQPGRLS